MTKFKVWQNIGIVDAIDIEEAYTKIRYLPKYVGSRAHKVEWIGE
jgi:hypothetical protein